MFGFLNCGFLVLIGLNQLNKKPNISKLETSYQLCLYPVSSEHLNAISRPLPYINFRAAKKQQPQAQRRTRMPTKTTPMMYPMEPNAAVWHCISRSLNTMPRGQAHSPTMRAQSPPNQPA